ncbi:interferon regulatory factor 1 isoform X4 [Hyperolius riggenbachi]
MPVKRLRLRPWLEKQIESKTIPGLSWLNKEEMIFQIPWKHAARHGWDLNKDACLFRQWAIHTGRYKDGEKEPDPKTWKANFRCAMNSLPDIKEVKDRSIYKGSSAARVYKMLPTPIKIEKKERKSRSQKDCKNKPRKKQVDGSSADEVEEAVKFCPLPEDHSGYTAASYTTQEACGSSDMDMSQCNASRSLSDWSDMEMPLPDSTNDLYHFQVSPIHSSSEADDEDLLSSEFLTMLEPSSNWQQTNMDGRGYLISDLGTTSTFMNDPSSVFEDISKVLGEIEVRVTTDMKPIEFSWQELTAITCL